MIFKLKSGRNIFEFKGFQNYTGKQPFLLVVMFGGEPEMYDWDGSDLAVEELKRYYMKVHEVKVLPLRYNEVI